MSVSEIFQIECFKTLTVPESVGCHHRADARRFSRPAWPRGETEQAKILGSEAETRKYLELTSYLPVYFRFCYIDAIKFQKGQNNE